jgi:hypothetical protein
MKKNYSRILLLVLTLCIVVLTGCQIVTKTAPTQEPTAEQALSTSPTSAVHLPIVISPAGDKTAVCGRIVTADGSPFGNLNIRLAEVYYGEPGSEGAFVLNTSSSPSAMTDKDGFFCTGEIAVTDYILIIGHPEESYEIYAAEDSKAKVWSPLAGEVLELGEIVTTLDPNL